MPGTTGIWGRGVDYENLLIAIGIKTIPFPIRVLIEVGLLDSLLEVVARADLQKVFVSTLP